MKRARVLLADDNADFLQQVIRMLGTNFEVVGALPDGESVLQQYQALQPDILILDISMEHLSGLDVASRLFEMGYQPRIIFLTVHEESEFVRAAFDRGAVAYVVKSRLSSDLAPALQSALAGHIFVSAT